MTSMANMRIILFLALALALVTACGDNADPPPPDAGADPFPGTLYACHVHAFCPSNPDSEYDQLGTPCSVGTDAVNEWQARWLAYCELDEGDLIRGECDADWQCDVQCVPTELGCAP